MVKIALLTNGDYLISIIQKLNNIYKLFVITHNKKPQGRGRKIPPNTIADFCHKNNIQFCEVENINTDFEKLCLFVPDILLICDFKDIIKEKIISIAKIASINIHPSLLPLYRGATPIQSAILNNDCFTGFSIIEIVPKVDSGKIYYQRAIPLYEWDNFFTLRQRIFYKVEEKIVDIIENIVNKKFHATIQDEQKVTFSAKFIKEDGLISWSNTAHSIYKKLMAFSKWPGVYFYNNRNKKVNIISANIVEANSNEQVGKVITINSFGIFVQTTDKILQIIKLKPENKKVISALDYVNGYKITVGSIL